MMFPVAILAGGLATRMRPLTETVPKALLDVNGEPFIIHQLRLLREQGITEVVICTGYLGHMIEEVVGNGNAFDLHVTYSPDGDRLLGTGGALKKALPLLGDNFFIIYGDSYLPCDYFAIQTAFKSAQRLALMTVFHNANSWDKSNVEFVDGQILIYDKQKQTPNMHYIDYGLGIIHAAAFSEVPSDQVYDLATLYQHLLSKRQLAAYEVKQRFYEIGSFDGLKEFSCYLDK